MSKHTKGPWRVVKNDFGVCIKSSDDTDIRSIADIYKYPPDGLCEDNAQLIAAAPEMLDALDTLTAVIGLMPIAGNKSALQEAFNQARAVIAKAIGETL